MECHIPKNGEEWTNLGYLQNFDLQQLYSHFFLTTCGCFILQITNSNSNNKLHFFQQFLFCDPTRCFMTIKKCFCFTNWHCQVFIIYIWWILMISVRIFVIIFNVLASAHLFFPYKHVFKNFSPAILNSKIYFGSVQIIQMTNKIDEKWQLDINVNVMSFEIIYNIIF